MAHHFLSNGKSAILTAGFILLSCLHPFASGLSAQKTPRLLISNVKNDSQLILDKSHYLKVYYLQDGKKRLSKGKIINVDSQFLYLKHHAPIKLNDITKIKYINKKLRILMLFLSVIFVLVILSGSFFLALLFSYNGQERNPPGCLIASLLLLLEATGIIVPFYFFHYHKIIIDQGWALSPLIQP